jgi:DNA-binding MarR family transcriptional regulator
MATDAELSACRECRCLAARRYARAVTRVFEAQLRPHRLRATQFSVLAALALKGPTPVTELAALLGLERTTLTRVAAVLERRGCLAAGRSDDARTRMLRLVPAGRRTLDRAFPAWQEGQRLAARQFPAPPRVAERGDNTMARDRALRRPER